MPSITGHSHPVYRHRRTGIMMLFRYAVTHPRTCGQWVEPLRRLLSREEVG